MRFLFQSVCRIMVDLSKKVTVKYKGRKVFKGKLNPSADTARKSLFQRGDPS